MYQILNCSQPRAQELRYELGLGGVPREQGPDAQRNGAQLSPEQVK